MNDITFRKFNSGKFALGIILLAAAVLRFYNLGEMSLSNDELSSLSRIKYDSFSEMISKGVYIDFHPAGLQIFLFYWVKIFGDGVFILRLPFVISGIASTFFIYLIGKKWYNELTALLAAASFGCLIFTILFTQLARMYSPGILFSLITVYFWSDLLFSTDKEFKKISWWGWTIAMSVAMHLHYFSFIFTGIVGLSGLFFVHSKYLLKYLSAGILALVFFIPEIPIFLAQIKTGDIGGWLGPPTNRFLLDFFYELFNNSILICSILGLVLMVGIFLSKSSAEINRWRILSLVWFFTSFLIAYLYSIFRHPILMYSTLLFVSPFLLLFIFSFVPKVLLNDRFTFISVMLFLSILIYDTVIPGKIYTRKYFGVFREITDDEGAWIKKYGSKNVPLIVNVVSPDYLDYYFKRMSAPPSIVADRIQSPAGFSKLFDIVGKSSTPYFAYVWSNSIHPFEVPEIIRHSYPYLISKKNYFNAASYLFSKMPNDSVINSNLFSATCDFENNLWNLDLNKRTMDQHYSGTYSQLLDVEYSTSLKKKVSEIAGNGFRYISFSANVFVSSDVENAQMIISFDRNGKPLDYHGALLTDFKLKPGTWQPVIIASAFPAEIESADILNVYFWNPSKKLFYIDDLKVKVYEEIDPYLQFDR